MADGETGGAESGENQRWALPMHALTDAVASIVLVLGTAAVEFLRESLLPHGLPTLVAATLRIIEATFFFAAIAALLSAVTEVFERLPDRLRTSPRSGLRHWRRWFVPEREHVSGFFSAGIVCTVAALTFVALTFLLQNPIALGFVGVLVLALILLTLRAALSSGPDEAGDSFDGSLVVFILLIGLALLIFLVIVPIAFTLIWVFGGPDSVQRAAVAFLNR